MEQQETALSGPDVQRILGDLCARGSAAQLHIMGQAMVLQARFVRVSGDIVFMGLVEEVTQIQLGEVCNVSFTHKTRPFLFMSAVEDYAGPNEEQTPQLALTLPALIVGVDLRRTQRVPVEHELEGLTVRVVEASRAWTPRLLDLSLAGMLVEFSADDSPELTRLSRVQVELSMGADKLMLRGVIRRANGPRFGVFFSEVLQGAELAPPAPLLRMVAALEERWRRG